MIKVELLEYLQLKCNCEYLSDLKYSPYWLSRLRAMKRPEQFTVEEWNQALEYLTGQPVRCQTLREVQAEGRPVPWSDFMVFLSPGSASPVLRSVPGRPTPYRGRHPTIYYETCRKAKVNIANHCELCYTDL